MRQRFPKVPSGAFVKPWPGCTHLCPKPRAGRTILGPQPCKLSGTSGSLPCPLSITRHSAPTLRPLPGEFFCLSPSPLGSLLPRDFPKSSGPKAEAEEERAKSKGRLADLPQGVGTWRSRRPSWRGPIFPPALPTSAAAPTLSVSASLCDRVIDGGKQTCSPRDTPYLRLPSRKPPSSCSTRRRCTAAAAALWTRGLRLRLRRRLRPAQLVRARRASPPRFPARGTRGSGETPARRWRAARVQPGRRSTARSHRGSGAGSPGKARTNQGRLRSARGPAGVEDLAGATRTAATRPRAPVSSAGPPNSHSVLPLPRSPGETARRRHLVCRAALFSPARGITIGSYCTD